MQKINHKAARGLTGLHQEITADFSVMSGISERLNGATVHGNNLKGYEGHRIYLPACSCQSLLHIFRSCKLTAQGQFSCPNIWVLSETRSGGRHRIFWGPVNSSKVSTFTSSLPWQGLCWNLVLTL